MEDRKNLTTQNYKYLIDYWFKESKELPINDWNVFQPARGWIWCSNDGKPDIQNGRSGSDTM